MITAKKKDGRQRVGAPICMQPIACKGSGKAVRQSDLYKPQEKDDII